MPTPNFHDLPDGSSSVNHTGESYPSFDTIDFWDSVSLAPTPPATIPPSPEVYPEGVTRWPPCPETPTEFVREYLGSFQPPPTPPIVNGTHNTAIGASAMAQNNSGAHTSRRTATEMLQEASERFTTRIYEDRPARTERRTATEVARDQEEARRINPAWRTAPYEMDGTPARHPLPIDTSPQVCDPNPPRRVNPRRRRGFNDPDAEVRKDPNAWSLREAVELCKLLEVVLPEAGFHIALTGGLLYKEGRRKDCDLMFYQIRGVNPNYEVLWKYLTVAGVIRRPDYPENDWLVKATYRGKQVDCLFPNAETKKSKVSEKIGKKPVVDQSTYRPPTPPIRPAGYDPAVLLAASVPRSSSMAFCGPETMQALREEADRVDRETERRRMAACEHVPGDFENASPIPQE